MAGTVWHDALAGADIADGLSWATAQLTIVTTVTAATAGDEVQVGAGIHAMGDTIMTIPAVVSLNGAGRDLTTISSANNSALYTIVELSSNCRVSNLTIHALHDNGEPTGGGINNAGFTNAVIENVRLIAVWDGIFIDNAVPCSLSARDVWIYSKYDGVACWDGADQVDLFNTHINVVGPAGGGAYPARGIVLSNAAHLNMWGGEINAQDGDTAAYTAGLYLEGTSSAILFAVPIKTSKSNNSDKAVSNTGSGDVYLIDCPCDPCKLSNTGAGHIYVIESDTLYHADIQLTVDNANTKDEWTITWFRNGVRITTGITLAKIQLVKRADGTNLLAATSMTQIGTTGSYKYDDAVNRITAGEAVLAIATATIDGQPRAFAKLITRDSAAP